MSKREVRSTAKLQDDDVEKSEEENEADQEEADAVSKKQKNRPRAKIDESE